MEPLIHKKIGKSLIAIRKARGLSLDKVAELTSVSKAMLGQIERGDSNPTISVLWKIVNGLRISFSSLMEEKSPEVKIVSITDVAPFEEDNGHYRSYLLFPYDHKKGVEVYAVEMDPGCSYTSEPHYEGIEEHIVVTEGELLLTIDGEPHRVPAGSAIHFTPDQQHTYTNAADHITKYNALIYYPS